MVSLESYVKGWGIYNARKFGTRCVGTRLPRENAGRIDTESSFHTPQDLLAVQSVLSRPGHVERSRSQTLRACKHHDF